MHWICWTANEFSFQGVEIDKKLSVLGKDLCAMHREDFVDKAPPMLGDILWEHLEILQKGEFTSVFELQLSNRSDTDFIKQFIRA